MGKNVMISLSLFERIIELLDGLDAERYGYNFVREYDDIIRELNLKLKRLELRKVYARIITADNEEARRRARIKYLRQKSLLSVPDAKLF